MEIHGLLLSDIGIHLVDNNFSMLCIWKGKKHAWIAVASAIMPLTASAHSIWINMSNWNPSFGYENKAWSTMYIGWGHRFPVDGFTNRQTFDFIDLITPDGKREKVELDYEGISASELSRTEDMSFLLQENRLYIIHIEKTDKLKEDMETVAIFPM